MFSPRGGRPGFPVVACRIKERWSLDLPEILVPLDLGENHVRSELLFLASRFLAAVPCASLDYYPGKVSRLLAISPRLKGNSIMTCLLDELRKHSTIDLDCNDEAGKVAQMGRLSPELGRVEAWSAREERIPRDCRAQAEYA